MNTCRTCLKTPANKDISELEKGINEDDKNYLDIMMFCLDITITRDSKITTNLCFNCYRKIISFYKFKALALKNDAYLKSVDTGATLVDHKTSVYVDENGVKHENSFDFDEYGQSVVKDYSIEFKEELDVIYEDTGNIDSDEEPLSVVQINKCEDVKDEVKENAPVPKKHGRRKKNLKKEDFNPESQVCEECGKSVRNIKEHSLVHLPKTERQTFQCKACPKVFFGGPARARHYRRNHLSSKSECQICHKKVFLLSEHMKRIHNPASLPIGCLLCEQRFASRHALDAHMPKHTKDRPFECDICHRTFATKARVGIHIRQSHLRETPHHCHVCRKGYFSKNDLQNHLRVHLPADRPYPCEVCGKCFYTRYAVKVHGLIHSDVKAHHCQHCDKSFARRGALTTHMVSHTKERKFQCRFCDARYSRSTHRLRHERARHPEQVLVAGRPYGATNKAQIGTASVSQLQG